MGELGQNNRTNYSSPKQIPGTTWKALGAGGYYAVLATKTDGTLWAWGNNADGALGQNTGEPSRVSSLVQIPGTTWDKPIQTGYRVYGATKTDGTLWIWGYGTFGQLASNNRTSYSSPIQVPGTTWDNVSANAFSTKAIKTDGTMWVWGYNDQGTLGQNSTTNYSSPVQVPGTTWRSTSSTYNGTMAIKTDNTIWSWGNGWSGDLGQNTSGGPSHRSSPIQIGSETDWVFSTGGRDYNFAIREDTTP